MKIFLFSKTISSNHVCFQRKHSKFKMTYISFLLTSYVKVQCKEMQNFPKNKKYFTAYPQLLTRILECNTLLSYYKNVYYDSTSCKCV